MKTIRFLLHPFYQIWVIVLFCILIPMGTLISLGLIAFSRKKGTMYRIMCICCKVWAMGSGIFIRNIHITAATKHGTPSTCIYVCNHESYLDIPTLYGAGLPFFLFLSKQEVLRFPVIGLLCSYLAITVKREERKSKEEAMKHLLSFINQQHTSICIFPEGTFYANKEEIIDFQIGAFTLATKCRLPLYPLLLLDTRDRLHPRSVFSFSPGINRIVHLPPITAHLDPEKPLTALELMHHCRQQMITTRQKLSSKT